MSEKIDASKWVSTHKRNFNRIMKEAEKRYIELEPGEVLIMRDIINQVRWDYNADIDPHIASALSDFIHAKHPQLKFLENSKTPMQKGLEDLANQRHIENAPEMNNSQFEKVFTAEEINVLKKFANGILATNNAV